MVNLIPLLKPDGQPVLPFREGDDFVNLTPFEIVATLANLRKGMEHEYVHGPKTQFRRIIVVDRQPAPGAYRYDGLCADGSGNHYLESVGDDGNGTENYHRLGALPATKPGQRLFVRETFATQKSPICWTKLD